MDRSAKDKYPPVAYTLRVVSPALRDVGVRRLRESLQLFAAFCDFALPNKCGIHRGSITRK
eukprot:7611466-Pyramimonas_sp.AAC.1